MLFPKSYKILTQNSFYKDEYSIVPIRYEDRFKIMEWRNEQIYHLRQSEPLTKEMQDNYFKNVVADLFDKEKPNQILFSYLKNGECIGYGGLVHINWIDKNAEISFIMKTALEEKEFEKHWGIYLDLIEEVAFKELKLHKIYTYAYDLRPRLYLALEKSNFKQEATLLNHKEVDGIFRDVIIHSKYNLKLLNPKLIKADFSHAFKLFQWANDKDVRLNAFNSEPIILENHIKWFTEKLKSENTDIYLYCLSGCFVGQVRADKNKDSWVIDYSVDKNYRGHKIAYNMLKNYMEKFENRRFIGHVKKNNVASIKTFQKLDFKIAKNDKVKGIITFEKRV